MEECWVPGELVEVFFRMLTQPKLLTEAAAVRHLFLEGSLKQFDELKEATQA